MIVLEMLEHIAKRLDTVNDLILAGDIIRLSSKVVQSKDAILTTIFDSDACLVGHAVYKDVGDSTPSHRHEGVTQYLLQYKGRVLVEFENGAYRIVGIGECVRLEPNELHKVTGLTDYAEQMFICIPAEKGYRINKEELLKEKTGIQL